MTFDCQDLSRLAGLADNVVTSRVEGIHSLLKSHLKRSTLDLFEAWTAIKQALLNHLAELKSNQAKQQIRTPIELSGTLYSMVRGWISHEALRKVEEQRRLLLKPDSRPLPACTGSFAGSHGLPCVHKLERLLLQDQALQMDDFHTHWHLMRKDAPRLLLEPRRRVDIITSASSLKRTIQTTRTTGEIAFKASTSACRYQMARSPQSTPSRRLRRRQSR